MISSNQIEVSKLNTFRGHKDCIYTLAKGEKKASFFSAGGDGQVVLWDIHHPEGGKLIAKVSSSVYALHFMPERNILIVGQNFEGIHLIDVHQKSSLGSLAFTKAAIFDIKVHKDIAIATTGDGSVYIIDLSHLRVIHHLKYANESARTVDINPEVEEFAVGYSDNMIRVFDLKDFSVKKEYTAHKNSVFTVRYSPDYQYLLSGSRDAHLKVWDVKNEYVEKESIVAHMYAINHIDYHPNGEYFVTCSMDKAIKVWDAQHFRLLKVIDKARYAGHATSVNKLLWIDNYENQLDAPLLSGSDDRSISLWAINFNNH